MSDIFVSYAREDRSKAQDIAEALQDQGWTVWWDRNIPPGKTFDEVISKALNTAKCVIVLWSEASARSDWVKEEANEGARRHILVPVLIEDVEIPLGFRRIHSAMLVGWTKHSETSEFNQFLQAVAGILGVDVKFGESSRPRIESEQKNFIITQRPDSPERRPGKQQRTTWLRWPAAITIVLIFGFLGVFADHVIWKTFRNDIIPFFALVLAWLIGLVVAYLVWKRLGEQASPSPNM